MDYYTIGERIRYLRELNNYTREVFAEKVDISSKFLYEIESGKKGFSADTLYRISTTLSVSCDYILSGNENNKSWNQIMSVLELFDIKQQARIRDILLLISDLGKK